MGFEYYEHNKYDEYDIHNEINEYLDPQSYSTKEGDIKVDSLEFKVLLSMFGQALDMLKEVETGQDTDIMLFHSKAVLMEQYMKAAYVMLGSLREKQKKAYDDLHKFRNKNEYQKYKEENPELVEEYENILLAEYIDIKTKRENLKKEVSRQKDQLKNMDII